MPFLLLPDDERLTENCTVRIAHPSQINLKLNSLQKQELFNKENNFLTQTLLNGKLCYRQALSDRLRLQNLESR